MADAEGMRGPFVRPRIPKLVIRLGRSARRSWALGPRLGHFAPVSTLELPETPAPRARVPAINFHAHLGRWLSNDGSWIEPDVAGLVASMDELNIAATVNLDGRWDNELQDNLERYDRRYPGRFYTFCHVDWQLLSEANGPELLATSLRRSVGEGARGLKVWKDLGTRIKLGGRLILHDDPQLEPLWEEAGRLGIPVLVHVGDPVAFFRAVDRRNERLEELRRYPSNSRQAGGEAERRRLMGSFEAMVAAHPKTTFVAAHGYYPENLAYLSSLLERCPNFHVDIAWAHLQLGRQPRAAHQLLTRHSSRVLFGTDVFPIRPAILPVYFRFLQTADESFSYTDEPLPRSGRWPIYGLDLPHDVLAKVYAGNARRLLGLDTADETTDH